MLLPLPAEQVLQDAAPEQEKPRPLLVPADAQTRAQNPSGSSIPSETLTDPEVLPVGPKSVNVYQETPVTGLSNSSNARFWQKNS